MRFMSCMKIVFGLVIILSMEASSVEALTDPADVAAMNSLYVNLGYPPLQGWILVGGDPCGENWQGVICMFANITALKLSSANLGGQLGDSLQAFGSLIEIDLNNNHIGGSIPPILPPTVRNVSLSMNQLTGSIPGGFATLSQLMELSLDNNHISGDIPDVFLLLTSLTRMDLSSNNLTGQLGPSFASLSSLTTLYLQNNRLGGTLDVLQDLPLQDLNIENNLFSGPLPPKLLTIPDLRKEGNPFNTTILLSPPAPAPVTSLIASAPASGNNPANGPSPLPVLFSHRTGKSVLTKPLIWIAIGAVSLVLLVILCGLMKCFKLRSDNKKRNDISAYKLPTKNTKYNQASLEVVEEGLQMEKVPKEAILKPLGGYGAKSIRTGMMSKPKKEKKIDTRSTETSMQRKDPEMYMTNTDEVVLPPPPPFFLGNKDPIDPFGLAATSRPKSSTPSSVKVFSIASLQQYTNSFSEDNLLGAGMLGSVYTANLPDQKLLAVKKLDSEACRLQSDEEFLELVSKISEIRHVNIVELVGYCAEHEQWLLVYKYCGNGTLHDALHTDDKVHKKLSWSVRIRVALGAARALEYLHEVCQPPMVHHNFKSANLLLDEKLEVHVSDCGLAPLITSPSLAGHLLTAYGSSAPEFESGCYTRQSDVYSFGVVMLELLTGRKAYDRSQPRGEQYLVRWAVPKLHDIDALSRMVDPSLNGTYAMKSLSRLADIISSCIHRDPEFRPPISEIVQELLQITWSTPPLSSYH